MFAESSATDLFRKFKGNESNCSTNQMARKPMNADKNLLLTIELTWKILLYDEEKRDCSVQKWKLIFQKFRASEKNLSGIDIQKAILCQNSMIFH